MAIQRRVNWLSQIRADIPAMRSIESASSNDWDQSIQAFITNDPRTGIGYVLRGFNILNTNVGAASGLQMVVDPGALMHINASQSGTVYMVPPGTVNQQLNSATNTNVTGAFTPNAINYIGLDYVRYLDTGTDAQSYFWDPSSSSETTSIVPQAQILTYTINISTTVWPTNLLPIATVKTDSGNNVLTITDCRSLLFRLGTGGADPNPLYQYPWIDGRAEDPSTAVANGPDPFYGGDKQLASLKDWMNAIMTSIAQIQGTAYWYTPTNVSGSLVNLREDTALTVFTGNSTISNGVLPNTTPVLTTTGSTTSGSNQLTGLASTTGLLNGQTVIGAGIPNSTTILSITGSTVTLSNNATATASGISVTFYASSTITAPGQINWASNPPGDGQLYLKIIGSRLDYQIAENPTGNSVTLADNEVAYLNLTRNAAIAPNLIFTNGSAIVTSVGGVSWTFGLQAGDWIKQSTDLDSLYFQILTINSLSQVTLNTNYTGTSTPATGASSQYAYGQYTLPGATNTIRDIQLADRASVPFNGNIVWLFLRSDDSGSIARVYVKFLGAELQNGDSQEVSGPQLGNVLQYIGSPIESAIAPQYVATVSPGALPQITTITVGDATTVASNQYFFINSAGNNRSYYVWINKDGTGVDPAPLSKDYPIEWNITTGMTATQVATALVNALNSSTFDSFAATSTLGVVTVTNTSAGTSTLATNNNVGSLTIAPVQAGTGTGNFAVKDGDNLTLAIKELDEAIQTISFALDTPSYDETITIVSSGGATPPYNPPVSITGPISSGTDITLPNNSRLGNINQKYTVGNGTLQIYLNGQELILGNDWAEVGNSGAASSQIQILQSLVVGDELDFRIVTGGGSGGVVGPSGPTGATGPAGADALNGPINISTKTSSYTVLTTDGFLLANCTGGTITFTLPPAASVMTKNVYYFKKVDSSSNPMVIQANGSEIIDSSNTLSTAIQYQSFSMVSNGTQWWLF